MECTYKKNSNKPCDTCPRLITTLYMCNILKEIQDENNPIP